MTTKFLIPGNEQISASGREQIEKKLDSIEQKKPKTKAKYDEVAFRNVDRLVFITRQALDKAVVNPQNIYFSQISEAAATDSELQYMNDVYQPRLGIFEVVRKKTGSYEAFGMPQRVFDWAKAQDEIPGVLSWHPRYRTLLSFGILTQPALVFCI